jgi:hypothetical protein
MMSSGRAAGSIYTWAPAAMTGPEANGGVAAFVRWPVALAGLDPVAAAVGAPTSRARSPARAVGRPGFTGMGDHPEAAAG